MTNTKNEDESAEQIAEDVFREALIGIRAEIRRIHSSKRSKKGEKHTPTERIAYLAKQASSFAGELRKAQAAKRKHTESVTKALVLDWYRALDASEKDLFVRELQQLNTKRSSLS